MSRFGKDKIPDKEGGLMKGEFMPISNEVVRETGSVARNEVVKGVSGRDEYGAGGRDRTCDLRFTKPLLYQLSYASSKNNMKLIIPKVAVWD